MTLRKITFDNSVIYVKKSEQTRESEQSKSTSGGGKTKRNNSNSRKQNKNISQNNKKFLNSISASGFKILK